MSDARSIFIGDKITHVLGIIEEEGDYYPGELQNKYADEELATHVELRGNYLYVEVDDD